MTFVLNGYHWRVIFVDPHSEYLIDRTGRLTVATTDPTTMCVYISDELSGDFLLRVLLHEMGHCCMLSFDLIDDIHRMTYPRYWIEAEEWLCNFIADYGALIFETAYEVLGIDALYVVPEELNLWMR